MLLSQSLAGSLGVGEEGLCTCLQHLTPTNLRAVIMVCRESPAKLSQGTSAKRWNRVGCGQYEVRGEKRCFANSTTCQPGRQGREGFFKKLEDGKERRQPTFVILGKFCERSNVQTFLPMFLRDNKERIVIIAFSQYLCCFRGAKVK